jgi:hypothetical protein
MILLGPLVENMGADAAWRLVDRGEVKDGRDRGIP